MMASPQQKIRLFAAGSLRAALTEIGQLFAANTGHEVAAKFGPSGLLKDAIAGGCGAHLFASANMEHPRALNRSNSSGPVFRFARNSLCALVRPGLDVDPANLIACMLDPTLKLATSASPKGDHHETEVRAMDAKARSSLSRQATSRSGSTCRRRVQPPTLARRESLS